MSRVMPATESTPVRGRLVTRPFLMVTAATAAFFVYVGVLVPIVPRYVEDELGGGEFGVGLNIAAFAVAAIAVRPIIGRLADQYGRKAVMIGGSLLAAAAGAASGLTDSLPIFLGLRAIMGVGEASMFVGAATLIADLAPAHRRAEAASYFSVAVFGGLGVGPILGEAVLGDDRFVSAFIVAGLFAVIASLVSIGVPARVASPKPNAVKAPTPSRRPMFHGAALGPGSVLGFGIAAFAVFSAFVPEHARDIGMSGSGGLFATYSVVCLVLRIVGARLPERLGARRAVTIAFVMEGAALALLAAVPETWALWAAAAIIGVGMAFMYPSLMALTVNRVTDSERAGAVSSFTMFFEIGSAVGGVTLGVVAEVAGKQAAFAGAVLICAAGLYVLRTYVTPRADAVSDPAPAGAIDPVFVPVAGD
jgi:MFS family permease